MGRLRLIDFAADQRPDASPCLARRRLVQPSPLHLTAGMASWLPGAGSPGLPGCGRTVVCLLVACWTAGLIMRLGLRLAARLASRVELRVVFFLPWCSYGAFIALFSMP